MSNCGGKEDPKKGLSYSVTCSGQSCTLPFTFHWQLNISVHGSPTQVINLSNSNISTIAGNSLKIFAGSLQPQISYALELKVSTPSGNVVSVQRRVVIVNESPVPGSCQPDKWEGFDNQTVFTVNCSNWKDPDLPLLYRFQVETITRSVVLLYNGTENVLTFRLPAGQKETNYTTSVAIYVTDNCGAETKTDLRLKVSYNL